MSDFEKLRESVSDENHEVANRVFLMRYDAQERLAAAFNFQGDSVAAIVDIERENRGKAVQLLDAFERADPVQQRRIAKHLLDRAA